METDCHSLGETSRVLRGEGRPAFNETPLKRFKPLRGAGYIKLKYATANIGFSAAWIQAQGLGIASSAST